MQLRFPNCQTVPLFHSRKALSDPSPEQVKLIARETTFIPAGHEAVILGDLLTQSFPEKSEGSFEPSTAFCEKHQLLAFSSLCESGEMIPARLNKPVEDLTVYKGMSLGSFSVVGSAEIAAMNRVIADLPDHPQGQVPDKYDVKEVIKQTQSSVDPQIRAQFAQLLRTFSDVFSKSEWDIGECDLVQHKIDHYPGSKPVKLPNRRMPMHLKKDLRQKIDKFLEHKLITPWHSLYSSPPMLVPKKNGKLRLVIDNWTSKQWNLAGHCLLLKEFDTSEGSCYFSTIDMSWGFYQLPLETSSQVYTAISTPFGSFKWLVMPMGLIGSPPVFQSLMEKVLVGLTWKSTITHLDDCIIFSRTAEHIARLREVFQRFKDANLKINPLKCEFFRQQVPFLGHIVSRDGIQADPAKTSAVRQYPVPKSVTEVKSFLGTLFLLPTVRSRFRRHCSTSSAVNRKNEWIPLEPRSPNGIWTTERLRHVKAHFSLPFYERAIHPIYWCKSICHRHRPCPSTEWPRASHLLRLQISQQSSKSLLDNQARTFSHSQLHKTLQALPSRPTIQDHYRPQGAPVAPYFQGSRRLNCSLAWKTRCLWLWDWTQKW